jgi:hypothetical protein
MGQRFVPVVYNEAQMGLLSHLAPPAPGVGLSLPQRPPSYQRVDCFTHG